MISWVDKDNGIFKVDIRIDNLDKFGERFMKSFKEAIDRFMESGETPLTSTDQEFLVKMIQSRRYPRFSYTMVDEETIVGSIKNINTDDWYLEAVICDKSTILHEWLSEFIDAEKNWVAQVRGHAVETIDGEIAFDEVICFDLLDVD